MTWSGGRRDEACRSVYERAVARLGDGHLDEAIEALETVIARGGRADPWVHLARFYRAEAYARRGEAAYRRGDHAAAVTAFELAFSAGVADVDRVLACGAALLAAGRALEAERAAASALALEPDTLPALALLALARAATGESSGDLPERLGAHGVRHSTPLTLAERQVLETALEASIGAALERRLAAAELAAGRLVDARARFAALLAADDSDLKARAGLICVALRRDDADEALRLVDAFATRPGGAAGRAVLQRYLCDLGCGREAAILLAAARETRGAGAT